MSATITVDASKFMHQMARMQNELGMDMEEVLRTQSRLLGERLIHFTPPTAESKKGKASKKAKGAKQPGPKGIGLAAVDRDLHKVTGFPSPEVIRDDKLRTAMRKIIARKDYDGLQAMAQHVYPRERYLVEPFTPQLHMTARSSRTHRVEKKINRLSLNSGDFKRYVKEVQSHVGRLRAGWIPFLTFGKGTAAAWVQRHAGRALSPHIVLTPGVKSIAVTNRGFGITRLAERFRDAVKTRARDMEKWVRVQLRLKKKQLQLT